MKPYSELTRLGKARRLRDVAFKALAYYDLEIVRLELVDIFTSALFRVRTARGESYAVRLCAPGWRTDRDIRSEVM